MRSATLYLVLIVSVLFSANCRAVTDEAQRVRQLVAHGAVQEAEAALRDCSDRQVAQCQLMLAEWIERGELVPRDMVSARDLYELALKNGAAEAGPHILRLLRGDELGQAARSSSDALGNSGAPRQGIPPPGSASGAGPASSPNMAEEQVLPSDHPPLAQSRTAACEGRVDGRVSVLGCSDLLLALQPVAVHDGNVFILVRVENRRTEQVTVDHSHFSFTDARSPVAQVVDTSMAIAIDERSKKGGSVAKGLLASALAVASAVFQHNTGLDYFDFDPAYLIADGIGEKAGEQMWDSIEEVRGGSNTTTVGYISDVVLPPSSFTEGLLVLDRPEADGVLASFSSPYGVGSVGMSGP